MSVTHIETPAVILRSLDYGESDCVLTLFTPEHGKLAAFVAGARRSKKRGAQALDIFGKITAQLQLHDGASQSMWRLNQFQFIDMGMAIRQNLATICQATLFIDCLQKITTDHDPHPDTYMLLDKFLSHLGQQTLSETQPDLAYALIKLLSQLGFMPEFFQCCRCHNTYQKLGKSVHYRFSANDGGIVCSKCQPVARNSAAWDMDFIATLSQLIEQPSQFKRLRLTAKANFQLHHALCDMVEQISGTELKSRRMLPWIFPSLKEKHEKKDDKNKKNESKKNQISR